MTTQRLDNLLLSIVEERRLKLEVHYNQQLLESFGVLQPRSPRDSLAPADVAYDRRVIGFLRGRVLHSSPDHVLLDVAGVGYSVHIPVSTYSAIERARAGRAGRALHPHPRARGRARPLRLRHRGGEARVRGADRAFPASARGWRR